MTPPRLIVGLGNPGAGYEDNRHNLGFWFVDALARDLKVTMTPQGKFHGQVGRDGDRWLLKPTTFMNRSGQAVVALARFYKILPDEILVVHDELDLQPGGIRLKQGGGNGGHNGLKDIQAHLTVPDFWRLRIGIGHPGERSEVVNFVLKPARREEQRDIDEAIDKALALWPQLARGELNATATKLNARPKAAKQAASAPDPSSDPARDDKPA